jgi:hypothetical protein
MTKRDLIKEYQEQNKRFLADNENIKYISYTEWLEQELLLYKNYYD